MAASVYPLQQLDMMNYVLAKWAPDTSMAITPLFHPGL